MRDPLVEIRNRVRGGLYYLTEHAAEEAQDDGFDVWDVECGLLGGGVRRRWRREGKYEVVGAAVDDRPIGVICRLTAGGKVRVVTVYAMGPKVRRKE